MVQRSHIMENEAFPTTYHTGDLVLEQLLADITNPDVLVRKRATAALAQHRDPRTLLPLISLLNHRYQTIRNSAFEALWRIGAPSIPVLLTMLNTMPTNGRCSIISLLGMLQAHQAVPQLITALSDPLEAIRRQAAMALGNIGDPAAFEPLLNALHSADIRLAAVAATALGQLDDRRVLSPLSVALRSPHVAVRIGAITGLGYLGERTVFDDVLPLLRDRNAEIRYAAVMTLGRLGEQRAVPELSRLAQTDTGFSADLEPIAAAAAIVVGKLGGEWSLDAVCSTIENTQIEDLYVWAVRGLCALHPDTALDLLINQLHSADAFRRYYAVVALGEIGDLRAGPPLMEIAHTDTDVNSAGEPIADAAAIAIERIRERQRSAI
jgi:HEAT repeat protein